MKTQTICLALAIVMICPTASAQGVHTNGIYPKLYLTMIAGRGGTVSPGSLWVIAGQSTIIRISASPDSGYYFTGWTGQGGSSYTGLDNPHDIQLNTDVTEVGSFALGTAQVTVRIDNTPLRFNLEQNYPNPFNPSTTIKFELPGASQVNLTVFDILGREVSVLVNERSDAGVHEVKFDGSNLASGVYLYRLQAGDYVASKKMLVLK